MRILGITSRLPWPLTDGARIVMHQAVRGLASRGHDIHLVLMEEAPEEGALDLGDLESLATLHIHRYRSEGRAISAVRTLFNHHPTTQARKDFPEVDDLLDDLLATEQFDALYADQSHIAHYASRVAALHDVPYLFRSHNVEHEIWRRHLESTTAGPMKLWLQSQYRKWKRYEIGEMALADYVVAITDRDADTIRSLLPMSEVGTIPAAVDLERFVYTPVGDRKEKMLLLLGGMGWAPNRDAAVWFANDIAPLIREKIPEVEVTLVGSDPPLNELPASESWLSVEGYVDDILPYYGATTIGVIPLRVGGGMRVKIVEMMASGIPCVSTSIGAEGNEASSPEHYLCADSASEIAAAIVRLLESEEERERLSRAGRDFVESTYGFAAIAEMYENAILRAIDMHEGGDAA